jgi:hypothetical protein
MLEYAIYRYWGHIEMLLLSLAWKQDLHPVTIAHFLEISMLVVCQNIYIWVPSTSGMRALACDRLLEYAIYMYKGRLEKFLLGLASRLG